MKKGSSPVKGPQKKDVPAEEVQIDFSDPNMLIGALYQDNIGHILLALKNLKSQLPKHSKFVLEANILQKLMQFIMNKNSSLDLIEFSLSLLAELLNYNSVLKKIASENDLILFLYQLFKNKPIDIQVNVLKCFSSLTKLQNPCNTLFQGCDLNLLFTRLSPSDPDNQTSILKILYNLVQDIVIAEKVVNLQGFNFNQMLHFLSSDYPMVQHLSANLIYWFTSYNHITALKELLIQDGGVNILLNIIETHKWPDLHEKIFKIFINLSVIDETFDRLGESGLKSMISYIDDIESQKLEYASYDGILKMSRNSPGGLHLFIEYGLMDVIQSHLKDDMTNSMFKLSIVGLATVSKNENGLNFVEENPDLIFLLLDILNNQNDLFDWNLRYEAADAIFSMVTRSPLFLENFKSKQMWKTIINLLYDVSATAPSRLLLLLLEIIKKTVLDFYATLKQSKKYISKLIYVIKHNMMNPKIKDVKMKCLATEIMETLVEFSEFREELRNKKVYTTLAKLVYRTDDDLMILESYLKLFITLCEWDPYFIDELIYVHAIDWFVGKNEIIRKMFIARRFLDLIFSKCAYLKMHYTNRLDLWDKIQTGFYIERGGSMTKDSYFKPLRSILKEKDTKLKPVYYVDFGDKNLGMEMRKTSLSTLLTIITSEASQLELTLSAPEQCTPDMSELLKDSHLKNILEELKSLLGYQQDELIELNLSMALNTSEYKNKLQILAEFVCKVMNSVEEITEENCKNHSFELHLTEIKEDLGTAAIPLGHVKIGTKFEKALLFKTLGDQVGIPSALVRGHCGNGWNEIYLTPTKKDFVMEILQNSIKIDDKNLSFMSSGTRQSNINAKDRSSLTQKNTFPRKSKLLQQDKKQSNNSSFLRSRSTSLKSMQLPEKLEQERIIPLWHLKAYYDYMKTNFIVDLDQNPGDLIRIGSVEAEAYMTKSCCLHPYFFERSPIPPLKRRTD